MTGFLKIRLPLLCMQTYRKENKRVCTRVRDVLRYGVTNLERGNMTPKTFQEPISGDHFYDSDEASANSMAVANI